MTILVKNMQIEENREREKKGDYKKLKRQKKKKKKLKWLNFSFVL